MADGAVPRLLVLTTWREHPPRRAPWPRWRRHWPAGTRGCSCAASRPTRPPRSSGKASPGRAQRLVRCAALPYRGQPVLPRQSTRPTGARPTGDLGALMAEAQPPAAVHEVLPGASPSPTTLPAIRCSPPASWGGSSLSTPADTVGSDEDAALDSGPGPRGRAGRRGRRRPVPLHPRAGARHRAGQPGRRRAGPGSTRRQQRRSPDGAAQAEIARHWLATGPRHLGEAWRAPRARATVEVFAYIEALDARARAARPGRDPTDSTPVRPAHRPGRRAEPRGPVDRARGVTHEAVEAAEELGDVELLVTAGAMTSTGALWNSAAHAEVDDFVVDALRQALDRLPPGTTPPLPRHARPGRGDLLRVDAVRAQRRWRPRRSRWRAGSATPSSPSPPA